MMRSIKLTEIYSDFNKQMRHLTELKKKGLLGYCAFYVSRSDQVKIIYNNSHLPYKDFMKVFPEINQECRL